MVIIIQTQPFLICNDLHIDVHPWLINCLYMRLHKREDSIEMCTDKHDNGYNIMSVHSSIGESLSMYFWISKE